MTSPTGPVKGWDSRAAQDLQTDRLAFLAAQPELLKRPRPFWSNVLLRLALSVRRGPGSGGRLDREVEDAHMSAFAGACEVVSQRLSSDEVSALRQSGQLPEWFIPAVLEEARRLPYYPSDET